MADPQPLYLPDMFAVLRSQKQNKLAAFYDTELTRHMDRQAAAAEARCMAEQAEQDRLDSLCTADDRIAEFRSVLKRMTDHSLEGPPAEWHYALIDWARKALKNDDRIAARMRGNE